MYASIVLIELMLLVTAIVNVGTNRLVGRRLKWEAITAFSLVTAAMLAEAIAAFVPVAIAALAETGNILSQSVPLFLYGLHQFARLLEFCCAPLIGVAVAIAFGWTRKPLIPLAVSGLHVVFQLVCFPLKLVFSVDRQNVFHRELLYPLYVAYSLYRGIRDAWKSACTNPTAPSNTEETVIWDNVLSKNIFVVCNIIDVFNIIVIRTYMQNSIPAELQEAARIDGCGDFQIFLRVVLPLCRPILFVMVLYAIVGYWNNYFNALLYIQSTDLYPLQRVLQDMLVTNSGSLGAGDPNLQEQLKYVTIVVSSLPLLIIYPFFQKYFETGVVMGGVKG